MNKISLSLIACLLLAGCQKKETLVLFGTVMKQEALPRTYVHELAYLEVCHLDQIYNVVIPAEESAEAVRKTMSSVLPASYAVGEIITVYLFTTDTDTLKVDITIDEAHAMSIIRQQGKYLIHDYFERQDDKFVQLPEFSADVTSGFEMDDIRLLHFASSPGKQLPGASTFFEFRMKPLGEFASEGDPNVTIGDAMLMNMNLNKGMNTLDLYGTEFMRVMARDNPPDGKTFCGKNESCGPGSADDVCIMPAGGDTPKPTCHSGRKGCCNQVLLAARAMSADGKEPFDFRDLFDFKDNFLMKYSKGREYAAYFYLVGRHMKMNPDAMKNYVDATVQISHKMEKMQGTDDNAVIVDDEFINVFTIFTTNHLGSGNKELETAMRTMKSEMMTLKGATRAQVMQYLDAEDRKAPRKQ